MTEIEMLVDAFSCVMEGRGAYYVSSPLTTGERAFEWHLRNGADRADAQGEDGAFRREVFEPNQADAAAYARNLREQTRHVVIDPTALPETPGWTQADYRVFWGRIIERYAETVVFRDGWHFSSGCAFEFLSAYDSGARLVREDLAPLSVAEGKSLIVRGIEKSHERGASAEFLQGVLQALEELAERS